MTVDPNVGSAGGQPRLLLPNMTGFGAAMDANLRSLYTWANSLLLPSAPSGAGMLALAVYSATNISAGPITWVADTPTSGFAYLSPLTELSALPADSYTRMWLGIGLSAGGLTGDPLGAQIQVEDSTPLVVLTMGLAIGNSGGSIDSLEDLDASNELWIDSASPPGAGLPYTFHAGVYNVSHVSASLILASWTKP